MLDKYQENGPAPVHALSAVREMLAKNIAARNPNIGPGRFSSTVTEILFALTAARLLESAGCVRGSSGLNAHIREQGLLKGLSAFLTGLGVPPGDLGCGPSYVPGGHETQSRFSDLILDEGLTENLIALTEGPGFTEGWKDYSRETGTGIQDSFLSQQVRLSSKNRMVIEETGRADYRPGPGSLQATCVREVFDRILDEGLSGRDPGSGNTFRILDPCPGTGRTLAAAYAHMLEWHLSWYRVHLVPQLRNGKDPLSRSVQNVIPRRGPGIEMQGFCPLPVCETGDGDYCLTWGEKARILAESVFASDDDPQVVMVSRLSLLSHLLDHLTYPDLVSFKPDLVIGILCRNIRTWDSLGRETGYGPQVPETTGPPHHGDRPVTDTLFPDIAAEGGFDLVICRCCSPPLKNENETFHPPLRHRRAAGRPGDLEQACIRFGLSVLKKGGVYLGTGTGRWLRDPGASRFRVWLSGFQLQEIIWFAPAPVHNRMKMPHVLTSIINTPASRSFIAGIAEETPVDREGNPVRVLSRKVDQRSLGEKPWLLFEISPLRLRNLIQSRGSALSQVMLGEYFQPGQKSPGGLLISREHAELVMKKDPILQPFLLPFVCSGEISPYSPIKSEKYLVVMPKGTTLNLADNKSDPVSWFSSYHATFFNIFSRVSANEHGPASRKQGCWWEWTGRNIPDFLHGPVLLLGCGGEGSRPGWAIAPRGAYPGPGVAALPARDLSMIGILNSFVFLLYLFSSAAGPERAGAWSKAVPEFPLVLPDPECSAETDLANRITLLVKRRLSLGSGLQNAPPDSGYDLLHREAAACEDEIDRDVGRLYGMTDTDAAEARYIVSMHLQKLAGGGIRRR